ncbi:hypothetical protein FA13DRAFT_1798680 [Coprinellus micaceus]|uniref:Uncharacterized protein n=1 Tax=Coprinellus micaceus TaxID=71717 RepID=A0A4Y7SLD3_COPMI|nr:hypothetical protein FA13DRAFT_1798680 [Coprinellus micaceus]
MPELRECVAFFTMVQNWFRKAMLEELSLRIVDLVADAVDTKANSKNRKSEPSIDESPLSPDRLPFALTPNCPPIMRGHTTNQHDAFPPSLRKTDENPNPPMIQSYTLVSIDKTMRSLILEFRGDDGESLWLKLSYLTHTCVQIYTPAQWHIIATTPKPRKSDKPKKRSRIGLAIVMKSHTLAFVSNDLLFEPIWRRTKAELPNVYLGVYDQEYDNYLQVVVDWIRMRKTNDSDPKIPKRTTRKAWDAIKSTQDVFMGVGVYTACELLFDAGIPPWISEAELVDCPSRMARLCEALWAYAHRSFTELGKLISPAMAQGVLAPTKTHRLAYKTWLHVWAREWSHMPSRMRELAIRYGEYIDELSKGPKWYRNTTTDLHDIFDSYFILPALTQKSIILGDLIWLESEWFAISGRNTPLPPNRLKTYYQEEGLMNASTFLKPNHYTELGLRGIQIGVRSSSQVRFDTYHYYWTKQFWTVFRLLPDNSEASPEIKGPTFGSFKEVTGAEREERYFENIIQYSEKVAIGPLEYSANGTQARTTHGEKVAHPLKHTSREETLAFYQASRSASSSTASLVIEEESDGDDGDEVTDRKGEEGYEEGEEEGEEGYVTEPPLTSASEGEFSILDDEPDEDEDDDAPRVTVIPRGARATKRLPSELLGSDCDDDDDQEDSNPRPRKSTRTAKPKAGYAFTKRGYAKRG